VIYVRKQSNATVIQAQGNIRTDRSEEFISLHAELHHTHTHRFETTECETAVWYLFQQMFKYLVCLLILLVLVNCYGELESVKRNELFPTNWTG